MNASAFVRVLPLALAALLGSSACGGGGSQQAANAVIGLTLAGTASAISRAQGGCYALCTDGAICNPENGLCEFPCGGRCGAGETCSPDGRCVIATPFADPKKPPPEVDRGEEPDRYQTWTPIPQPPPP